MATLNQVFLEGEVVGRKKETRGRLITIRQLVGGKMESDFLVFFPEPLSEGEEVKSINLGDTVKIYGAQIYTKKVQRSGTEVDEPRIRVKDKASFEVEHVSYYLGDVKAEEKFI